MSDLDSLIGLCPPPEAPLPGSLSGLAGRAVRIPKDHREMIVNYGVGSFDDFLWIYGEGVKNHHLDILARTELMRSILAKKPFPELRKCLSDFGLLPDDLVQWGGTDNGDSLLWMPAGGSENWPTVIIEARQRSYLVVQKPSTGIVLDLLSGLLRTSIFPDDFPSASPEFRVSLF